MSNKGTDSGYTDGYNQGLLKQGDKGSDQGKEYYETILERDHREDTQLWKEEGRNNDYSEQIQQEYEEFKGDDQWSSHEQNNDSTQTQWQEWFENSSDKELRDSVVLEWLYYNTLIAYVGLDV